MVRSANHAIFLGEFMDFDRLVSKPRMRTYRKLVKNSQQAEKLYLWNLRLSSAFYEMLILLEIAMRNVLDEQLKIFNAEFPDKNGQIHSEKWTFDPNELLQNIIKDDLKKVKKKIHGKKKCTHDDVVAQLPFGTWRFLLPGKNSKPKEILWNMAVSKAFVLEPVYYLHNSEIFGNFSPFVVKNPQNSTTIFTFFA
jgi:hypothetical protein